MKKLWQRIKNWAIKRLGGSLPEEDLNVPMRLPRGYRSPYRGRRER